MKKMILSLSLLVFGFANAQEVKEASAFGFSKGNVFIEGQLSFESSKETLSAAGNDVSELKISSVNFSPKAGYFVTDDFAVGVQLELVSGKREETTIIPGAPTLVEETKVGGFGAGVFARYYFLKLGERFKTYTELGVGFGSAKVEDNSQETAKINTFGAGLDLGINYFVTKNIAISFGLADVLAFNSTKEENKVTGAETKSTGFNGNVNVINNFFDTPTFGLLYKF